MSLADLNTELIAAEAKKRALGDQGTEAHQTLRELLKAQNDPTDATDIDQHIEASLARDEAVRRQRARIAALDKMERTATEHIDRLRRTIDKRTQRVRWAKARLANLATNLVQTERDEAEEEQRHARRLAQIAEARQQANAEKAALQHELQALTGDEQ